MRQEEIAREWARKVHAVVVDELRRRRTGNKLSAQKLAERCAELGYPLLTRSVITNIENGAREQTNLAEWLVLAQALDIPLLLLMFPLGRVDEIEVLPGQSMTPWNALEWAERGSDPPPNDVVHLFREHQKAVALWRSAERQLRGSERFLAGDDPGGRLVEGRHGFPDSYVDADGDQTEEVRHHAEQKRREMDQRAEALQTVRGMIRGLKLEPPRLPLGLRYLDDDGLAR